MEHTQDASVEPASDQSNIAPDITIYVDPQSPDCRRLKEYLQRKRLTFFEHDVKRDISAQEYLQHLDIDAVPVTRVGEDIVIGFNEARLNELIKTPETATAS